MSSNNQLRGPTHLQNLILPLTKEHWLFGTFIEKQHWRGKLCTPKGQDFFRLKYFGKVKSDFFAYYILDKNGLPLRIDVENEGGKFFITLLDKNIQGFEGVLAQTYQYAFNTEQLENRQPDSYFFINEEEWFQVLIQVTYKQSYAQFLEEQSGNIQHDKIALDFGVTMNVQDAFDNAFDAIEVILVSKSGAEYLLFFD